MFLFHRGKVSDSKTDVKKNLASRRLVENDFLFAILIEIKTLERQPR